MQWRFRRAARRTLGCCLAAMIVLSMAPADAVELEVFHADSLAAPMRELKSAYEAKQPGVTLKLTSGVSKQLAERIIREREGKAA